MSAQGEAAALSILRKFLIGSGTVMANKENGIAAMGAINNGFRIKDFVTLVNILPEAWPTFWPISIRIIAIAKNTHIVITAAIVVGSKD